MDASDLKAPAASAATADAVVAPRPILHVAHDVTPTALEEPARGGLRARFLDAKAARLEQFLAARPTARAALRLVRGLAGDVDATLL